LVTVFEVVTSMLPKKALLRREMEVASSQPLDVAIMDGAVELGELLPNTTATIRLRGARILGVGSAP
jgi:hypothetical protein